MEGWSIGNRILDEDLIIRNKVLIFCAFIIQIKCYNVVAMENLIFCLNATVPIFLLMVLGYCFKKINIFTSSFTKTVNAFVFKIALPVLVFKDLSVTDFIELWDGGYVLFCFLVTLVCITISLCISMIWKKQHISAEFTQSAFRSSAALLGIGIIQNIYGSAGISPLMIIGCVPLYNVTAVILLSFLNPNADKQDSKLFKKTALEVITNPIIIGIALGIAWSLIDIPQPVFFAKTISYIAGLATPLGLMALGASIEFTAVKEKISPAIAATFLKLFGWCAIFLPIAYWLGYTDDKLVATLIMLGSPTTVSCFIMSKSMGHDGTLSATTIMLTTIFSAFSLTFWLYILKTLGLI